MQTLLVQGRNPDLRAYFVWGPYLQSDSVELARMATERFLAPNAAYFWESTPSLSRELAGVLRLAGNQLAWDVYLVYRKRKLWEDRFPGPTYWQHQLDVLQGEPLDLARLEGRVRALLAEK
jgi:hypothetical protein